MSVVANKNFNSVFVTFTQNVRYGEQEFLIQSQWKWLQKKSHAAEGCKCKGTTWSYLITQDVDGCAITPVWVRSEFLIEEAQKRPKMERSFYLERRGDYFQDGEQDTLQPHERTHGKSMSDKSGYIRVNEGYLPVPDQSEVENKKH